MLTQRGHDDREDAFWWNWWRNNGQGQDEPPTQPLLPTPEPVLPNDTFGFDPSKHFCPQCLQEAREWMLDDLDTDRVVGNLDGLPILCDEHSERLVHDYTPRQAARIIVWWIGRASRLLDRDLWQQS